MKNLLYVIFVFILFCSPVFSQTAKDLYKQAVSYHIQGEDSKALEILDKINSSEINTNPLRKEIQKKLNINTEPEKEIEKKSEVSKADQELFSKAASLYNQGKYEEALQILKDISNTNLNTQPLIVEINKKIKAKTEEDKSKKKLADDLSKTEINKKIEDKEEVNSGGTTKTISLNKSEEHRIFQGEQLKKEENSVDLTSLDMPNNRRTIESPPPSEQQTNESGLSEKKVSNIFTNKYLFGAILFAVLSLIGFVMIKSKTNQRLLQLVNLSSNSSHSFKKGEIKIGRAPDNDFVINHDGISRYHAIIRYDKQNNRFLVKDLDSTNGTLINDKKIKLSELKNGDIINFYKMNYRVNY